MALKSFLILIAFVAFAAGEVDNAPSIKKALMLSKSNRTPELDLSIILEYLVSCPAALTHYMNCLTTNGHIDNPVGQDQICRSARIELNCMVSTFAATTCPGEQAAIEAEQRLRPVIESNCAGFGGSGAASIVARFFTIIMLAFTLLKM